MIIPYAVLHITNVKFIIMSKIYQYQIPSEKKIITRPVQKKSLPPIWNEILAINAPVIIEHLTRSSIKAWRWWWDIVPTIRLMRQLMMPGFYCINSTVVSMGSFDIKILRKKSSCLSRVAGVVIITCILTNQCNITYIFRTWKEIKRHVRDLNQSG